ncbi:hypothetical protein GOB29_28730 [Sinorhizobium meliloti]|nr:hypothetical protein [Sinorhizobium meliloti]
MVSDDRYALSGRRSHPRSRFALLACSTVVFAGFSPSSYSQQLGFTIDCEPVPIHQVQQEPAADANATPPPSTSKEAAKSTEECLLPAIPSYFDALVEQAITQKTLADEKFITEHVKDAERIYDDALTLLLSINDDRTKRSPEYQLLLTDISYRKKLIDAKSDFWGIGYFRAPDNPVKLLQELERNYSEFSAIVAEIEGYRTNTLDDQVKQATLRAVYQEHSANRQAEIWSIDKQSEVASKSEQTRQFLLQRLDDNQRRQTEIAAELREVWDSVDKMGDQLTNVAVGALASAAGIPPELASAIADDGPLEARLLQAGTSLLANSDFQASVMQLTPNVEELFEIIEIGHQVADDAETAKKILDKAKSAIRDHSIENIIDVGAQIWSALPEENKQDILKKVSTIPNASVFGELAFKNSKIRDVMSGAAAQYVLSSGSFNEIVNPLLSKDPDSFAWDIISDAIRYNGNGVDAAAAKARTIGAIVLAAKEINLEDQLGSPIDQLVAAVQSEVLRDSASPETVLSTIMSAVESGQVSVSIAADGTLSVAIGDIRFGLNDVEIRAVVDNGMPKLLGAETAPFLERLVVGNAQIRTPAVYLQELIERQVVDLGQLLDDPSRPELGTLEAFVQQLPGDVRQRVSDTAAQFLAGQTVGADLNAKLDRPIPMQTQPQIRRSENVPDKPEDQAALMLVTNAVPGGQLVGAALDAAKILGQMDLAIQKGKELYAEDKQLIKQQIHIVDMIVGTDSAKALAEYDREIARARSYGAAESSAQYLRAISRSTAKMTDAQAQARLRVPLAVFYAEQMRRNFDELNHALSLWVGAPSSPRGTIERLVRDDPQYIRFALDDQIQLYQWLVRDFEGDRTDLRALSNHWRQIVALSTDVCRRIGCTPDAAVLGPVKQTRSVSVSDLVGLAQWSNFLQWKANPVADHFEFNLLITPDSDLISENLELVRLVDVAVGVVRAGITVEPDALSLVHPGVAYVPVQNGEYLKEFYPLVAKDDLEWKDGFDLRDLRTRWARNSDLSRRSFEGRGLYTQWLLTVRKDELVNNPTDFTLRFAYQYKEPGLNNDQRDRLALAFAGAEDAMRLTATEGAAYKFTKSDLALLATENECLKVDELVTKTKDYVDTAILTKARAPWQCQDKIVGEPK